MVYFDSRFYFARTPGVVYASATAASEPRNMAYTWSGWACGARASSSPLSRNYPSGWRPVNIREVFRNFKLHFIFSIIKPSQHSLSDANF